MIEFHLLPVSQPPPVSGGYAPNRRSPMPLAACTPSAVPLTTPTPGGPAEALTAPFPGCLDPAVATRPRPDEAGPAGRGRAGDHPVLWNPHKREGPGTMGG